MVRPTKKQRATRVRTTRIYANESSTGTANSAGAISNSRASQYNGKLKEYRKKTIFSTILKTILIILQQNIIIY